MKQLVFLAILSLIFLSPNIIKAQSDVFVKDTVAQNKGWLSNSFSDNIFISVAGGAQIYNAEHTASIPLSHKLTPYVSLDIGKWVAPGWGVRLKGGGFQFVDFTKKRHVEYTACSRVDGFYEKKWCYYNIQGDFLVDLLSVFGTYDPKRVYSLIPFVGIGFAYGGDNNYVLSGSGGLINKFILSKSIDLNLEAQYLLLPDKFNGILGGLSVDGGISVSLGISYYFRERGFRYYDGMCPVELHLINKEVNRLRDAIIQARAINENMSKELNESEGQKPLDN